MRKYKSIGLFIFILAIISVLVWRVIDQAITIDYMRQGFEGQRRVCLSLVKVSNTVLALVPADMAKAKLLEKSGAQSKSADLIIDDIQIEKIDEKLQLKHETCL
jgi:hypothetical protein